MKRKRSPSTEGSPSSLAVSPRSALTAERLCKRCTDRLNLLKRGIPSMFSTPINETPEILKGSKCRLCRLLGIIKHTSGINWLQRDTFSRNGLRLAALRLSLPPQTLSPHQPTSVNGPGRSLIFDCSQHTKQNLNRWKRHCGRADLRLAKQWVQLCEASHVHKCLPEDRIALEGLKVIDCSQRVIVSAPHHCEYAALSYVWGSSTPESDSVPHTNPLHTLPPTLPRTIEDSISVSLELGFRYLWIDRYCIDQNDAREKHAQIQQMGHIYASAQLTIIAAAGEDPTHGLPGASKRRGPQFVQSDCIDSVTVVASLLSGTRDIELSPWVARAWTFQECYLSKRRLFFTDRQMVYICEDGIKSEAVNDFDRPSRHDTAIGRIGSFIPIKDTRHRYGRYGPSLAMKYMEEYSNRCLSHDTDALNAVIGILNTLQITDRCSRHICGVPIHTDCRSGCPKMALNWYHNSPCRRRSAFPSWSSLGWNGAIQYTHPNCLNSLDGLHIGVQFGEEYKPLFNEQGRGVEEKVYEDAWSSTRLEITGRIVSLTRVLHVLKNIRWDCDPLQFDHSSPLFAFFETDKSGGPLVGFILLLHDQYYERVGMFDNYSGLGKEFEFHFDKSILQLTARKTIILG